MYSGIIIEHSIIRIGARGAGKFAINILLIEIARLTAWRHSGFTQDPYLRVKNLTLTVRVNSQMTAD